MKILILSPLFPPDTGAPADYTKELATRLGAAHETSLLVYGYLPEAVSGVSVDSIDKRTFLLVRLFSYTRALIQQRTQDIVLVNNGPSIEVPFLFLFLITRASYVLVESDPIARKGAKRGLYKIIHTFLKKHARNVVVLEDIEVYKKAEVLPFIEFNEVQESRRHTWWDTHINHLIS